MVLELTDPPATGDDVYRLQFRLAYFGFASGGIDGVFGGGTARAVADFQRWLERPSDGIVDPETATCLGLPIFGETPGTASCYQPIGKRMGLSDTAVDLLVFHETGGRLRYENRHAAPGWPGASSGVTIGIGFDLGHNDRQVFGETWETRLHPGVFDRLSAYVGRHAGAMDADDARQFFGEAVDMLSDIRVPWPDAMAAFSEQTLSRYLDMTSDAFPEAENLPASCRGALVSLVYNRGPRLSDQAGGISRKEMRDIRDHLADDRIEAIAGDLRRMAERWPDVPGLQRRRKEEAELFEWGLRTES